MQLFKGSSSHWINQGNWLPDKFAWAQGYGVFSVSQSAVEDVGHYIATQEQHHRKKSFSEELESLVTRHELKWHPENR
jgi:putative transposase